MNWLSRFPHLLSDLSENRCKIFTNDACECFEFHEIHLRESHVLLWPLRKLHFCLCVEHYGTFGCKERRSDGFILRPLVHILPSYYAYRVLVYLLHGDALV